MKIISILSAKGGTGKSSIAMLLCALFSRKAKVLALDSDVQATCFSAKMINPKLPYEVVCVKNIKEILLEGKKAEETGMDWMVIDTNPRSFLEDVEQIDGVIEVSDLCVLPCRPAPRDIRANLELSKKLNSKKANARILWNFVQPRVNSHKESMKQASQFLEIKPFKNFLKQRICYQDMFDEPPLPIWNIKARNEMEKLAKEIKRWA